MYLWCSNTICVWELPLVGTISIAYCILLWQYSLQAKTPADCVGTELKFQTRREQWLELQCDHPIQCCFLSKNSSWILEETVAETSFSWTYNKPNTALLVWMSRRQSKVKHSQKELIGNLGKQRNTDSEGPIASSSFQCLPKIITRELGSPLLVISRKSCLWLYFKLFCWVFVLSCSFFVILFLLKFLF